MRRLVKYTLFCVGILLVVGVLSWPPTLRWIIQLALQDARKKGQTISWTGLSTGMRSAAFESLSMWIPGPKVKGVMAVPISLDLQQTALALDPASLLTLQPVLTYSTSLYGGWVNGSAQPGSDRTRLSAQFENVECGKHPQLASLGVRGGSMSGSVENLVVLPRGPESGSFSLKLRQLSGPMPESAKTLLRTDDLGSFDLDAQGSISPESLTMPEIRLSSRFGVASGSLTARNHLSAAPALQAHFDISLSQEGVGTVGPWLPFIPGSGLDSTTQEFSMRGESAPCSGFTGNVTMLRLGGGCVRLTFTKR